MDQMTELIFFDDSSLDSSFETESEIIDIREDGVVLIVAEWITATSMKRKRPCHKLVVDDFNRT